MCGCDFDLPGKEDQLARLRDEVQAPDLWDDSRHAQAVMRAVSRIENLLQTWEHLETASADIEAMLELAAEGDEDERASMLAEAAEALTELERIYDGVELNLVLGGEYDQKNAVLSLHAGAGGTEANDWTEMLLRMYLRWAESRGFKTEVLSVAAGDEVGVKSVEVRIDGEYAYGLLRSERGVHRLVRLSPFNSANTRQTTFALVEVLPEADEDVAIEIDPDDLRIDTYRAGGHGGQNVQKNDTAVRITHIPSGIVVTCQNERSQLQNREQAMVVLKSRLLEREIERVEAERAQLKGDHIEAGWGNQIRSYVLHPYKMVKDLRTNAETSDTQAVLDGKLDEFIAAYLRSQVGAEGEAAS